MLHCYIAVFITILINFRSSFSPQRQTLVWPGSLHHMIDQCCIVGTTHISVYTHLAVSFLAVHISWTFSSVQTALTAGQSVTWRSWSSTASWTVTRDTLTHRTVIQHGGQTHWNSLNDMSSNQSESVQLEDKFTHVYGSSDKVS